MFVPNHLLLHSCCAPCLIAPYHELKNEGVKTTVLWYNPNIHPVTEYRARLKTLNEFATREGFELILKDDYGLREFTQNVADDIDNRCAYCYRTRLELAAKTAIELGCDAFSSTLLYSKYQKHELICEIAEEMASKYGVKFFYQDWRELWDEGIQLSKEAEMYRQKYCGCIYSEEERYLKSKKKKTNKA
ncbi:MAG: epoxyqueuosine reductase QueH [Candidatus Cloacimonadaceae bacterium]|nr:epoxyqueuosine reductase QueH [Candidatus Cloacimonadota bacterium]